MSDASVFVPQADGRSTVPGYAAVPAPGDDLVLARRAHAAQPGRVERVSLATLAQRAQDADATLAVVALDDGDRALALLTADDPWQHTSLAVDDLDRAMSFYREVLGFEVVFQERGMRDQIRSITGLPQVTCDIAQLHAPRSPHTLELIAFHGVPPALTAHAPTAPGAAHVSFAVPDLERTIAEIAARGGQLLGEVTRFDAGSSVYCREPAGSFLELDAGR